MGDRVGGDADDETADEPGNGVGNEPGTPRVPALGFLLRRIRRITDLSQRQLATELGISASTVARVETGQRDLPATVLIRAAARAGLRLGLLDGEGREVTGMAAGTVRDRQGRRFPAHLDTRHGDEGWWHGPERYSRDRPTYTFDRDRQTRDARRSAEGTPPDHQEPRQGDSLQARARARRDAALARHRAAGEEQAARRRARGEPDPWAFTCSCPPGCDDLLVADTAPAPHRQPVLHLDECPCQCDLA